MNQQIDIPEEDTLENEDDFGAPDPVRNHLYGNGSCCLAILYRGFSG